MTLFAPLSRGTDDESELEIFRSAMASQVAAEAWDELDSEFLESGLAESDIEQIIDTLADASASCVVDAMQRLAEIKSIDVEQLIDDSESASVDLAHFDTQAFDQIILPCFYAAAENAGISTR